MFYVHTYRDHGAEKMILAFLIITKWRLTAETDIMKLTKLIAPRSDFSIMTFSKTWSQYAINTERTYGSWGPEALTTSTTVLIQHLAHWVRAWPLSSRPPVYFSLTCCDLFVPDTYTVTQTQPFADVPYSEYLIGQTQRSIEVTISDIRKPAALKRQLQSPTMTYRRQRC